MFLAGWANRMLGVPPQDLQDGYVLHSPDTSLSCDPQREQALKFFHAELLELVLCFGA